MKHIRTLATSACLVLALAGCTGGAANEGVKVAGVVATTTAAALTPDQVAALRQACSTAKPALDAAASANAPVRVANTASYAEAYCNHLAAAPVGTMPITTTANTPKWLAKTLAYIPIVAQTAGFLLPYAIQYGPAIAALL